MNDRFLIVENGQHQKLGDFVWWSLSRVQYPWADLQDQFRQNGLQENWLPQEPNPKSAYLGAVRCVKERGLGDEIGSKVLVRKILENSEKIIHGVVLETPDERAETLSYATENKITFFKDPSTRLIMEAEIHDRIFQKIQSEYAWRCYCVDAVDVSRMLVNIIESLSGVTVRKKGGVYFVPRMYASIVQNLISIVSTMGNSCVFAVPVVDAESVRKTMFRVFKDEMISDLHEAKQELHEAMAAGKKIDLNVRLERYKTARDKAKMYEDLLKITAEDVHGLISAMEQDVRAALMAA